MALLMFLSGAPDRTPNSELAGGRLAVAFNAHADATFNMLLLKIFRKEDIYPSSQQLTSTEHTPFSAKFTSFYLDKRSKSGTFC